MKKNILTFINIFLAVGLGVACLHLFYDHSARNENETISTIMTRTSVRAYTAQEVEKEKVEQILRAAMAAPTAMNRQPWEFAVITDRNILDALADSLPYAKMLKQAPLAIVVCGNIQKAQDTGAMWVQDASAATENLLLAAHSLGLGAVWTGVYPTEREKTVRTILNIPNHIIPLNVIPIGYPAEDNEPKDKWKPENIHYNAW